MRRRESEGGAGSEQTEQHWDRTGQAGFLKTIGRVEGNVAASLSIKKISIQDIYIYIYFFWPLVSHKQDHTGSIQINNNLIHPNEKCNAGKMSAISRNRLLLLH